MAHHKFIFESINNDLLIGLLSAFPFEAFSEEGSTVEAWLPDSEEADVVRHEIEELYNAHYETLEVEFVPERNWNETWESRFDPVEVGDFCRVRAVFHDTKPGYEHEVVIDPKQAFGTGHHETTYMMIETMQDLDLEGRSVLDLGCGTGILAILANKLGAKPITAIDIEQLAVDNTRENLNLNYVNAEVHVGSVEVVKGRGFDVILANINRNAIMFLMESIVKLLNPGGRVVFSGFLEINYEEVVEKAAGLGLRLEGRRQRGEWECVQLIMNN